MNKTYKMVFNNVGEDWQTPSKPIDNTFARLTQEGFDFEAFYDAILVMLTSCPVIPLSDVNSYKDSYTGLHFVKPENLRYTESRHVNYNKLFCETVEFGIVPMCYAEALSMVVVVSNDAIEMDANDCDLVFSRSCGWYNRDKHVVIDYELYYKDDCVILHDGSWCNQDDAVYCQEEDEYYKDDDVVDCEMDSPRQHGFTTIYAPINNTWTFNGVRYHDNVETYRCECCGENYPRESSEWGEYCSEDCHNQNNSSLERKSYSSNVINYKGIGESTYLLPKAYNTHSNQGDNALRCGIELECYADSSYHNEVNEFTNSRENDYCIATEDGSLDNQCGVEFIFRPETLKQQCENVDHFVRNNDGYLSENPSIEEDGSYGLHIHISTFFMSTIDKMKAVTFVNKNIDVFAEIGGRDCNRYSYNNPKSISKLSPSNCQYNGIGRSTPVNCTRNTVEYRFPCGIVDEDHIKRNIQMAWSLSLFCTYHCNFCMMLDDTALHAYFEYVVNHHKQYPDLADWITSQESNIELRKAA